MLLFHSHHRCYWKSTAVKREFIITIIYYNTASVYVLCLICKILEVDMPLCVRVRVPAPKAIGNYWHNMKPILLVSNFLYALVDMNRKYGKLVILLRNWRTKPSFKLSKFATWVIMWSLVKYSNFFSMYFVQLCSFLLRYVCIQYMYHYTISND